jgi:hypothetical protein
VHTSINIRTAFIIGGLVGAIFFLNIWGVKVLDINNINWILYPIGNDTGASVVFSFDFLLEPWSFPFGVIRNLVYPNLTSIAYGDDVPLMALICKIFSPFTKLGYFQYYGIWGLLCFILQGAFSAIIMRRYSDNIILIILSSMFFVSTTLLIGRTFGHISFGGQWILLAAISIVWFRKWDFIKKMNYGYGA